jgi:hypothetical protein
MTLDELRRAEADFAYIDSPQFRKLCAEAKSLGQWYDDAWDKYWLAAAKLELHRAMQANPGENVMVEIPGVYKMGVVYE